MAYYNRNPVFTINNQGFFIAQMKILDANLLEDLLCLWCSFGSLLK